MNIKQNKLDKLCLIILFYIKTH